tara:strand:+ start:2032 stop:3216 length:1185 start_codon:yes stop_codon:yes gene_type:complete
MWLQLKSAHTGAFFALWAGMCVAQITIASEPTENQFEFTDKVKSELISKRNFREFAGSYTADATFKQLPGGQNGRLLVEIANPENFDLPIAEVTASCGCTRATLLSRIIPAKGSATLEIKIDTPEKHNSGIFEGRVILKVDQRKVEHKELTQVNVNLKFEIGGLLCFKEHLVAVNAQRGKTGDLQLPFVCSVTTPATELQIKPSGVLLGAAGKIKAAKNGYYVQLDIDPELIANDQGFGTLQLTDPASGVSDQIHVVITVEKEIVLSPHTIRFVRLSSLPDTLVGRCIVRVRRESEDDAAVPLLSRNKKATDPPALTCDAKIGNRPIEVMVKPVNHKVYRISMSIDEKTAKAILAEQKESNKDLQISWKVISGSVASVGETRFVLSGVSQVGVE